MLNRSASLAMSTSVLKALPGKLDIKRHSPSILYLNVHAGLFRSAGVHIWSGSFSIPKRQVCEKQMLWLCLFAGSPEPSLLDDTII